MPQAIAHILFPLLLISFIRDFYLKKEKKRKFSLHYALIAGLAGIILDIDVILTSLQKYTHTLIIPLIFLFSFFIFRRADVKARICNLGRHKLKLHIIFLMLSIGTFSHILLDALFYYPDYIFYPFLEIGFGLNFIDYLHFSSPAVIMAVLDGFLFVVWVSYLELKHKISDFI
ncbi:MAG: hypothetical protein KKB31_05650 [Nanoarchaeota archaeon]|nr:hypothetical protein [Nanoarchaeota archaeon]